MRQSFRIAVHVGLTLLATSASPLQVTGQEPRPTYQKMEAVDQYLTADPQAEVALARSAAPQSIARDAEVQVLTRHGYEKAVEGKNGFVCIVGRGWSSAPEPDFWNPEVRVPMCLNQAAVHSYFLRISKATTMALSGHSPAEVNQAVIAAVASRELPPMQPGAMCYMMSKEGYGGSVIPHWPSHVMFFFSDTDPATWGANVSGSPVLGVADPAEHLTQFVFPVRQWSDGTAAMDSAEHHHR